MQRRTLPASIVVLATIGASGCVASTSDVDALRSQISELQEQVAQLKRSTPSKDEVQAANRQIGDQNAVLLKSNTTLVTKVDQLEERLATQQGGAEQTNFRVDKLGEQVTQMQHDLEELRGMLNRPAAGPAGPAAAAAPPPALPGPPAATPAPAVIVDAGESPKAMYQNAYRDYQQAHYDLAISGFRDFVQKYPASELADNAAYWIGECLYSQKKFRDAVAQFDRVVNDYPGSQKVPSALLKKGYAYISLGDRASGIVQLQYVVHEHPKSPEAAKAREELKKLGVETR